MRPGSLSFRFCDPASDDASLLHSIVDEVKSRHAGLILGPHGTGKSTLLHSLGPILSQAFTQMTSLQLFAPTSLGYFSRCEHSWRIGKTVRLQQSQLADGGLLVIDGAEQLGRLALAGILRRAKHRQQTILATSHSPIRGFTILHETTVDDKLIRELTECLIESVPGEVSELVRKQLGQRDLSKLSNVREWWFELYDVVQPHILDSN